MADNKDLSHAESDEGIERHKSDIAKREEKILEFWNSNNIFKKKFIHF